MAPINWHSLFFWLFSLVACGFALGVVLSSNVVRMAFYLVLTLAGTSGLFFLAGADFVGAMQIMIYVGGTLVLLIFGVMLTAKGPFITMQTSAGEWLLGAIVGGTLLALLVAAGTSVKDWQPALREPLPAEASVTATRLGMGLLGARVDQLDVADVEQRGGMSGYLLPFEIVSIHLLVVLIGAAYLARPSGGTWLASRARERKSMPSPQADILVTTTFSFEGYRIAQYKGLVRGIIVRAPTISQGISGGLKSLIGGHIPAFTEMCEQARNQAYELLIQHAEALGANAVVGVRYDASDIGGQNSRATEVLCYGTAVVVEQDS